MRRSFSLLISVTISTTLLILGCTTTKADLEASQIDDNPVPVISHETVLPDHFSSTASSDLPGSLHVPKGMLLVSIVDRSRAPIRQGPGVQYPISDQILEQGEKVLVFQRIEVWRKIMAINTGVKGWVHYQALTYARLNEEPILLETDKLPMVSTLHPVKLAYNYKDLKPIDVSIPSGRSFLMLMENSRRKLLWLPQTNSTMWLAKEDAE